ncbi:MAG: hypothetical protein WD401_07295 [Thermomicrobiaceae bacterium]
MNKTYRLAAAALMSCGLLIMLPVTASAHVKWFQDDEAYPLETDLILSWHTGLLLLVSLGAMGGLYLIQRMLGDRYWPHIRFLDHMSIGAPTLFAVQAAITLVHASVQPALFAPNMELGLTVFGLTIAAIQVFVALTLITGLYDWVGAIILILLGPLAFFMFPTIDVFEQLLWAGIGVFFLVIGRYSVYPEHARAWFRQYGEHIGHYAVVTMRVLVGLSFIALGLGEKLWNPDLGGAFLEENQYLNVFSEYFGMDWFTNELFTLLAGLTEATIGVLLISGILTRVVILGMWLPFNLGLPFLPPQELLGHLPIFGIMYVLLVYNPNRPHSFESRDEPTVDLPETTHQPSAPA